MPKIFIVFCVVCTVLSCSSKPQATSNIQWCKGKRPEVCVEIFQPVCAMQKKQTQCQEKECYLEKWVQYSNSCKACADKNVVGFINHPCTKKSIK